MVTATCFVNGLSINNFNHRNNRAIDVRPRYQFRINRYRNTHANQIIHYIRANLAPLVLSEENVNIALEEVVQKLGSVFGNSSENRDVGITGKVELASLDGPIVVLRLSGRFWHKRSDVVSTYINT